MSKILCIVTGGSGDGYRARRLLEALAADVSFYDVDKSLPRARVSKEIWQLLCSCKWDLVYQEGTGIAGGMNLIRSARQHGQRYVVSSGDPVGGFFHVTRGPLWGAAFSQYERLLYKHCAAFVGWTPYLTGAALRMGAPRAITVEGAVDLDVFRPATPDKRLGIRNALGIPTDHLVCGIVGSLQWVERQSYCYGLELVEMLRYLKRTDVTLLIAGSGDGRSRLQKRIPKELKSRVVFTGRLSRDEVVRAMNAMDIGFITQTLDKLGSYRLTTKLPEYLATGLPVAMSPIPGFYDYALDAGWPLPTHHPADPVFHKELAAWLDRLDRAEVVEKAQRARSIAEQRFGYEMLIERFTSLIEELLDHVYAGG